jgi:hypothetical protein
MGTQAAKDPHAQQAQHQKEELNMWAGIDTRSSEHNVKSKLRSKLCACSKEQGRALSRSYPTKQLGREHASAHERLCSLVVIQEQEDEIWPDSGLAMGQSKTHAAGGSSRASTGSSTQAATNLSRRA